MIFISLVDLTLSRTTEEQAIQGILNKIANMTQFEAAKTFGITKNQSEFFRKCIKPMAKRKNVDIEITKISPNVTHANEITKFRIVNKKINEFDESYFK